MSGEDKIKHLKKRLAVHRRRLRYWSGNPSITNFGPTGKGLQSGHMDMKYDEAAVDAMSIAQELEKLGVSVKVVNVRDTFRCRFSKSDAPEILIWPTP